MDLLSGFARDDGRTLGNVDSIGDQATYGVLASAFVIAFSVPPQRAAQVAAVAFVLPDYLVDALVAQLDDLFAEPAADLLGDQRIWRNFASILRRTGAVSLGAYSV